jgi:hypothetical protein
MYRVGVLEAMAPTENQDPAVPPARASLSRPGLAGQAAYGAMLKHSPQHSCLGF